MRKIYSLICSILLAVTAQATDVTFTFDSAAGLGALGIAVPEQSSGTDLTGMTVTNGPVVMTATKGTNEVTRIWNSQGTLALRVYQNGAITFTAASGTITGIVVTAASTSNFQFAATTGELTAVEGAYNWSGSASSVTLTHTDTKNAQVASVTVTVDTNGTPEGGGNDEPAVNPDVFQLDSLYNIFNLEDGTEFQFQSDVYVNYQIGNYLYVMQLDEEGYASAGLIYGQIDKQYNMGAVIPAGWTGKKTTYNGLVEITNVSGLGNATAMLDEYYYEPFDMTGYVSEILVPEYGYENFKVAFSGATISGINNRNFTITVTEEVEDEDGDVTEEEVTVAGYNQFNIELPEELDGETFTIEGIVSIYKNSYQIYPISITVDQGELLWKILSYGEDGDDVKVGEELYVVKATNAADGNLVYVTDNATSILNDSYADWGVEPWEEEWAPDFIALDCGSDTQLWQTLAAMRVLTPNSVRGTLQDVYTNPRIVLSQAPVADATATYPEIAYLSMDVHDSIFAYGNYITYVTGYYETVGGEAFFTDPDAEVQGMRIRVDFSYMPALKDKLESGKQYTLLSVWKQDEEWESDDDEWGDDDFDWSSLFDAPARKVRKAPAQSNIALARKTAVSRKAPKKILYSDPAYYTNLSIMPIADVAVGVQSLDATAVAGTTAVYNALGQRAGGLQKGLNIVVSGGHAFKVAK